VSRISVGVVGAGVMGQRHLRASSQCASARVVGIADHSSEASPFLDVPVCAELAELLALRPDAVIVATPAGSHREVVEECLAQGAHVLVEKPLASTVLDAQAMVDSARRAGCLLAVGHVERFSPAVARIREAVRAAAPRAITTTRLGPRPTRVRDVGVILDLAVHDIDLVRWLTGRDYADSFVDVLKVSECGRDSRALVKGLLDDGTAVTHEVSWLAEQPTRRWAVMAGDEQLHTYDLPPAGVEALVAQDMAFLAACLGGAVGSLATSADGAAAVEVALSLTADALVRARA